MTNVQIHVLPEDAFLPETPITVKTYAEPHEVGVVTIDGTAQIFLIDRVSCDRLIAAVQQVREHLLDAALASAVQHPKETP